MNVPAIRDKMNIALATIDANITVYTKPPHTPNNFPCLIVYPPDSIDYRKTRALSIVVFPVLALVGPMDPKSVEVLEALMSDDTNLSVIAKLYEDPTLDGTASNLRMLDITSGVYSIAVGASDNVLGCEFRVEVAA